MRTPHTQLLCLPAVPTILGFDPRYQFIHEDDIVGVLAHAVLNDLEGVYNGAADGVLAFSEILGLLGKPPPPILPPWGTKLAAGQLKRARRRRSPTRCSPSCASAAAWTTASSRPRATASATRRARPS